MRNVLLSFFTESDRFKLLCQFILVFLNLTSLLISCCENNLSCFCNVHSFHLLSDTCFKILNQFTNCCQMILKELISLNISQRLCDFLIVLHEPSQISISIWFFCDFHLNHNCSLKTVSSTLSLNLNIDNIKWIPFTLKAVSIFNI